MKKLRCFVAMAFGQDEVDAVFDVIKKEFRETIEVRRVDRINHNKNIDAKIFEELNSADFVIADLTFARPSVYFEAGYAEGLPIPVVYTAKQNHLGKNATEDGLRVHFDLRMRNIIGWTNPDNAFVKQLRSRVNLVTKPILARRLVSEERKRRKSEFAALSLVQQVEAIRSATISYFKMNQYRIETGIPKGPETPEDAPENTRIAVKMHVDTLNVASFWVLKQVRRKELVFLGNMYSIMDSGWNLNVAKRPPKRLERVVFVLTPGRVGQSLLRSVFPKASCEVPMTAKLETERIYLPDAKLWNTSRPVRWFLGGFNVGTKHVKADENGTYEGYQRTRIGNSEVCEMTTSFRMVSCIKDPEEISNQIRDTFESSVEEAGDTLRFRRANEPLKQPDV